MKIITILFFAIIVCNVEAQNPFSGYAPLTPEGVFDTLYDETGAKHLLRDLQINPSLGVPADNFKPLPTSSCTAGYFNVYYGPNTMWTGTNGSAYQAVLCKVLSDISSFISSPLATPGNTVKINIYCEDITTGPAGVAGAFYSFPWNPSNPNPGLADNVIFKAINTGVNPYSQLPMGMIGAGNFYHGIVKGNPSLSWHTNLSTTNIASTDVDFYSVMLHEVTHALGFTSLMGASGQSVFGQWANYYNRYDKHLKNAAGVPLLSSGTSTCTNSYLTFTGSATQINPSNCTNPSADISVCTTAARFSGPSGVNVAVYTPSCFAGGSSLSHFEDICSTPSGFTSTCSASPTNNNLYYSMCNSGGLGNCFVKRYLKPEERLALCDIGYSVKSTYTSTAAGANFNYTGGNCAGLGTYGLNDGFVNGVYTYTSTNSLFTVPIFSLTANDLPSGVTPACIEVVYGAGATATVGLATLSVNALNGYTGLVILKYYPYNGVNYGNDTYIYVYFIQTGCNPPNACDMIQNPGFESINNTVNCGPWENTQWGFTGPKVSCWKDHDNSPDLMTTGCTSTAMPQYNLGTNTYGSNPIISSLTGPPNNRATMLDYAVLGANNYTSESMKNTLSSPLIPNQTYILSFWAYSYNGPYYNGAGFSNPSQNDVMLTIASDVNISTPGNSSYFPQPGLNVIKEFTVPSSNSWALYTHTFVFNGTANHSGFFVGIDPARTYSVCANYLETMVYLDNFSLKTYTATSPSFVISPTCGVSSYTNLNQYVNNVTGGAFTGTGVVTSGTLSSFNSPPILSYGAYPVAYTYTAINGCVETLWQNIYVPGITTYTSAFGCANNGYQMNASGFPGGTTFTWMPGGQTTSTLTVFIGSPTIYTLTAANGTCLTTYTNYIVPNPQTISITPVPPVCLGSTSNLLNNYCAVGTPTNGVFNGPNLTTGNCSGVPCSFIDLINNAPLPGTYNYTYTTNPTPSMGLYCGNQTTFSVQYLSNYTTTILSAPLSSSCTPAGQNLTLTAQSTPSAGISYTWQPVALNGPTVVVTPTVNTTYTLLANNGGCSKTATTIVNVFTPVNFTNAPTSLCTYQNIFYLENWLSNGVPTTGTWTTPFPIYNTGTVGLTAGYVNPNTTPLGTQTVAYTYTNVNGCIATNQFTVNIIPGFSVTTNGLSTHCSNIPAYAAVVSATAGPGTGFTYTWFPGGVVTQSMYVSPAVQTIYTVVVSGSNGCQFENVQTVNSRNDCCAAGSYVHTSSLNGGSLLGQWAINQNITINGNVSFLGEILVAPNVSITINGGGNLAVINSHIYSCGNMWSGIIVGNGAATNLTGSLIEDAIVAVSSASASNTAGSNMNIRDMVFNRNFIAVRITDYAQNTITPPYSIWRSVFTCRDFSVSLGSSIWPTSSTTAPGLRAVTGSTNTVATPFGMQNYTPVNLKAPHSTIPSSVAILFDNSGVSLNPTSTSPTYYSMKVGEALQDNFNLFDNHLFGITSKNSNVLSHNNVFQNTRRQSIGQPYYVKPRNVGGIGIYGLNDDSYAGNYTTYISTVPTVSPTTYINQFYDCHFGIYADKVFELNCQYADFRSTQVNTAASSPYNTGQYGIYIDGNRLKNYQIKQNNFRNVNVGVNVTGSSAALNFVSGAPYGTYLGTVNIQQNYFGPAFTSTVAAGTGYINYAILAQSSLKQPVYSSYYETGSQLRIQVNNINRVYRGIKVTNFSNNSFIATTDKNTLTLVADVSTTNIQRGIDYSDNLAGVVNTNTITGYNTTNTLVAGIYLTSNNNTSSRCNITNTLALGFQHDGANFGTMWRYNTMQTNQRGMSLTNGGIIGPQGTYTAPSDNKWVGTWAGTNYGTWVDNLSTAYSSSAAVTSPSYSVLWTRTLTAGYTPPNPGGPIGQSYAVANALQPSNNNSGYFDCATGQIGGGGGNPPGGGGSRMIQSNGLPTPDFETMENVAEDNLVYYGAELETSEINKIQVFNLIDANPDYKDSSLVLQQFYNTEKLGNKGVLNSAEDNIAAGNIMTARSQLQMFIPASNLESNNKQFLLLQISHVQDSILNSTDSTQLWELAHKCPFIDGAIVYKARALYDKAYQTAKVYNDATCLVDGISYGRLSSSGNAPLLTKNNKKIVHFDDQVKLYPNPAVDEINIVSKELNDVIMFTVADVTGKVLIEQQLKTKDGKIKVKLNLKNGVYLVSLVSENGTNSHRKLIITN